MDLGEEERVGGVIFHAYSSHSGSGWRAPGSSSSLAAAALSPSLWTEAGGVSRTAYREARRQSTVNNDAALPPYALVSAHRKLTSLREDRSGALLPAVSRSLPSLPSGCMCMGTSLSANNKLSSSSTTGPAGSSYTSNSFTSTVSPDGVIICRCRNREAARRALALNTPLSKRRSKRGQAHLRPASNINPLVRGAAGAGRHCTRTRASDITTSSDQTTPAVHSTPALMPAPQHKQKSQAWSAPTGKMDAHARRPSMQHSPSSMSTSSGASKSGHHPDLGARQGWAEEQHAALADYQARRILMLPTIVCYGSNNLVLMETEPVARVMKKAARREVYTSESEEEPETPPALERAPSTKKALLPIPSHWPGEPDWKPPSPLTARNRRGDSMRSLKSQLSIDPSAASRTGTGRGARFASATEEESGKDRQLNQSYGKEALALSSAARNRDQLASKFHTLKRIVPDIEQARESMVRFAGYASSTEEEAEEEKEEEEEEDSDEERRRCAGRRSNMGSRGSMASRGTSAKPAARQTVSPQPPVALRPPPPEMGEAEKARRERWLAELKEYERMQADLRLDSHEDYAFSGAFGLPSAFHGQQHRFIKDVAKCNPVAFDVEAAQVQEEEYGREVRKAKRSVAHISQNPGKDVKLHGQFMHQLKELKATRPAMVWPDKSKLKKRLERSLDRHGQPRAWKFEKSIFAARYKKLAPGLSTTPESLLPRQLEFDWYQQRGALHRSLATVLGSAEPTQQKGQVLDALSRIYPALCQTFYYYAVGDDSGGDDAGCTLSFAAFKALCADSGALTAEADFADISPALSLGKSRTRRLSPAEEEATEAAAAEAAARAESRLDVTLSQLFRPAEFEVDRRGEADGLLLMTGQSVRMDDRRGLKARMDAYELKPLNRAEWLEALIRLAIRVYCPPEPTWGGDAVEVLVSRISSNSTRTEPTDLAGGAENEPGGMTENPLPLAVQLFEEKIRRVLPPEALYNPTPLRHSMHCDRVENIFKRHHRLLKAIFEFYKARDRLHCFAMRHWMTFLEAVQMCTPVIGLTPQAARLLYVQASFGLRAPDVESLEEPHMSVFDLLEGLARLAAHIRLPTPEEIRRVYTLEPLRKDPDAGFHMVDYLTNASDHVLRKHRPTPGAPDTRALPERLEALFEYVVGALCRLWDVAGCDVEELTQHMAAITETVWKFGGKAQQSFRSNRSLAAALHPEDDDEDEDEDGDSTAP